jgi:hypothetical protein
MANYSSIESKAKQIAIKATDQNVKAPATLVAKLAYECERTDKTANDAEHAARSAKHR